jgi:hypothetical protein
VFLQLAGFPNLRPANLATYYQSLSPAPGSLWKNGKQKIVEIRVLPFEWRPFSDLILSECRRMIDSSSASKLLCSY